MWVRKYVVIRRPYILIYNTDKDMVRGREGMRRRGKEKGRGKEREGGRLYLTFSGGEGHH